MARQETQREDLLREATALVERVELQVPGFPEPIVAGFRSDGSASFYFGPDPVYQFNSAGEFRRGYRGELLYKAEQGRLVALLRQRTGGQVALLRTELCSDESASWLASARSDLSRLQASLENASFTVVGEVPSGANVVARIKDWLAKFPDQIPVAQRPHAQ